MQYTDKSCGFLKVTISHKFYNSTLTCNKVSLSQCSSSDSSAVFHLAEKKSTLFSRHIGPTTRCSDVDSTSRRLYVETLNLRRYNVVHSTVIIICISLYKNIKYAIHTASVFIQEVIK